MTDIKQQKVISSPEGQQNIIRSSYHIRYHLLMFSTLPLRRAEVTFRLTDEVLRTSTLPHFQRGLLVRYGVLSCVGRVLFGWISSRCG